MSFLETASKRLYEPEVIPDLPPAQDTLAQKFVAWKADNPDAIDAVSNRAWELVNAGEKYLSMRDIVGDLRKRGININNSFTAFLADDLIADQPLFILYFHRRARAKGKMKRVYA